MGRIGFDARGAMPGSAGTQWGLESRGQAPREPRCRGQSSISRRVLCIQFMPANIYPAPQSWALGHGREQKRWSLPLRGRQTVNNHTDSELQAGVRARKEKSRELYERERIRG